MIELMSWIAFPLKTELLSSYSRRNYVLLSSNKRLDGYMPYSGHGPKYEVLDLDKSRL